MNDSYYLKILVAELEKLVTLMKQRGVIEVESAKCEEFISATINMLSEEKRAEFRMTLDAVKEAGKDRDGNLTHAIRRVLQRATEPLTVRDIRERLKNSGFDFSSYTSSPLASISTTLRRMKVEDLEATEVEGITAYRWKGIRRFPRMPKPRSEVIGAYLQTWFADDGTGYDVTPSHEEPKRHK